MNSNRMNTFKKPSIESESGESDSECETMSNPVIGDRSFGVADQDAGKSKEADPVTALAILKSKEIGEFITNIVKAVKS